MASGAKKVLGIDWGLLHAAVDKRRAGEGKPKSAESSSPAAGKSGDKPGSEKIARHSDALRETVESVVIAFVLAFLFRTFLAEAFVIPTGSMAPTLMGRHKDFACQQCGHQYTVGASDEIDKDTNLLVGRITTSICPNCSFTNDIYESPVFNGDRILVNKFPYELSEPDRFDVFVFRYPEDPQTNYIKRLVGLPGEALRIERGDLYARQGTQGEYQILRKTDPNKQRVLQQMVYDDTHPPTLLLKHGWPERWSAMRRNTADNAASEWSPEENSWKQDSAQRSFQVQAGSDWQWLRYRHLVPEMQDWNRVEDGESPNQQPKPQLIADFCGYNAHRAKNVRELQQWSPEAFWIGDLTLHAQLHVQKLTGDDATMVLELVEGVRRYRCEFQLAQGTVTLSRTDDLKGDGSFVTLASSNQGIKGTGRHHVAFANVDDRLCLWIDQRLIPLGIDAEFTPPPVRSPQTADLHPVGIAAKEAEVQVSQLKIQRDIYYRAVKWPREHDGEGDVGHRLAGVLDDPEAYNKIYDQDIRYVEFDPLDDDEYFAMGDNSARSYDGRLWRPTSSSHHAHAVNQRALIGKAFFVYWPHGIPFLNNDKGFPVAMHAVHPQSKVENYPYFTAPFYPQWWRWSRIR